VRREATPDGLCPVQNACRSCDRHARRSTVARCREARPLSPPCARIVRPRPAPNGLLGVRPESVQKYRKGQLHARRMLPACCRYSRSFAQVIPQWSSSLRSTSATWPQPRSCRDDNGIRLVPSPSSLLSGVAVSGQAIGSSAVEISPNRSEFAAALLALECPAQVSHDRSDDDCHIADDQNPNPGLLVGVRRLPMQRLDDVARNRVCRDAR
jgi:hypothetical protein